jgi:peptide-N4-(N-acetyl-beta-glucosaminyl)asparagine amidase
MSMLAKVSGTSRDFTQKVCHSHRQIYELILIKLPGWNRKLAYCIAFSIDGATDVTRRYVRISSKHGMPRNRVAEDVLLWAIYEMRRLRREKLSEQDHRRLRKEDEREERELRMFTTSALAAEITSLFPGSRRSARGDEQKTPLTQDEDAAQWINGRPRNESESQGPDSQRDFDRR